METVRIFDTTLRDGEQSPGATLTRAEKVEIARHLEAMGVDIIEAGFPISSPGDFESVKAIAAELTRSVVCGLARCTPKDVEAAGEAVKDAAHPRIHVFCATSKSYGEIFSHLLKKLPIIREKNVVLSSHCHNDLGLAVANSLAAVENGARQVECTINGIGERAGNAALEEIVMALRTRSDHY